MANYKKINNLLIVDPNPCGMGSVPLEKLNISVELEVYPREDDIIIYNTSTKTTRIKGTEDKLTKLSFINSNGDASNLTTNYTELNTKFNSDNPDLETLGIESIDISFNSALVPVVKIRFKDVRGKLFEQGNDSPYSFLFKMPYPIFYLTIKGYYGNPVRYALHMTKFSGSLDNATGSFIINCDFIGYTYAFLTDILMGYIKAIPYTVNGKTIINELGDFTSIEELRHIIDTFSTTIESYKNNDKQLASLTIFTDLISKLEKLEKLIGETKLQYEQTLNGKIFNGTTIPMADEILFLKKPLNKASIISYNELILGKVREFIDYNKLKENTNYVLMEEDFKLDDNGVYYQNTFINSISGVTWDNYQSTPNKIGNFSKIESIKAENENADIEEYYDDFKDLIESTNFKGSISNTQLPLSVIDFKKVLKKINKLKNDINADLLLVKDSVINNFIIKIKQDLERQGVFFEPSIGNFFKILCDHVDVFLKSIKKVGEDVKLLEGSQSRKLSKVINGKVPEYKVANPNQHVKAFPDYLELDAESKAYTDKWIGNNVLFMNSPEVIFINDFYEAILKSGKRDKEFALNGNVGEYGWVPVNPFDSQMISKVVKNPWSNIENSNNTVIYKLLVERMVTFLGYSNKTLTDPEIIDMAKIEAKQSFDAIKNNATKLSIINGDVSDKIFTDKIAEINKSNQDTYGLYHNAIDGDGNVVGYIYESPRPSISDGNMYLPLTQNEVQLKMEDNPFLREDLRTNSNQKFTSRLTSGDDDNGETFIKILNKVDYRNTLNYVDHSSIINNKPKTTYTRLTTKMADFDPNSEIKIENHNYILGGIYGTHEFMKYQSKDGEIDMFYEFYETGNEVMMRGRKDEDKINEKYDTFVKSNGGYTFNQGSLIEYSVTDIDSSRALSKSSAKLKDEFISHVKNKNTKIEFKIEPTFRGRDTYSLFGSDFYNSQTNDEAKALLFLHTIPFEGMGLITSANLINFGILESKVKNFFNQRAGVIEVPHSWALFLGGILYRASDTIDIITFISPNGGYDLIDGFTQTPTTTQYLNTTKYSISKTGIQHIDGTSNLSLRDDELNRISDILLKLPIKVRTEFINLFTSWVVSDFQLLKDDLEPFSSGISTAQRAFVYNNISGAISTTTGVKGITGDNYRIMVPMANKFGGLQMNFHLELRSNGPATNRLMNFLNETKILVNGTYRIWESTTSDYTNIVLPTGSADKYLNAYLRHFRELNNDVKIGEEADDLNRYLFNSTKVDDIKLKLYKNIKSIYDKWVVGVDGTNNDVDITDIFRRFKFIDRAYNDISDLFKIAPSGLNKYLTDSTNINFYNFISRILVDNNFDFIPLPTFTDYDDPEKVAEIFEPKTFNEATPSSGPQFICMYIGERSNKLDIQEQHGINKNDGWKINTICDNGNLGINNSSGIPDDFQSGNSSIPYFLVKYGDQNQSLFKNIKVDQMEFTETDEGLQIIEDLGNRNRNNSIGQNLFDIYTNRSYSAEVEMLGCAQIQPFMYFQLDNVPMFTGAYTIINTRHSIKPNHMTTTFKGVRIRYGKTKMIDDETLYYHLIGNLADVSNEGVLYDDSKTKIKDLKPKSYPPTHPIYAPVLSEFTPTELTTDIAQTYMERVAIEGVELPLTAIQLKEIADKYNYPFELMILQAAQESNFGTNGAATSTHNIFNVGNTTPGDTLTPEEAMARGYRVDYGKWEKGVRIYIQLMQRAYIPKSGSWTVLLDFNKFRRYDWAPEGHRYALDMDYEGSLRKHKEALNELI